MSNELPSSHPHYFQTEASSGLAILGTSETDFDGDQVQLVDYWNTEMYDNIPKDILKRIGLKMSINDQGEAEFVEREGYVSIFIRVCVTCLECH